MGHLRALHCGDLELSKAVFTFFRCMRYVLVSIPPAYGRACSSTIDGYGIFIVRTDLRCMLCTRGQKDRHCLGLHKIWLGRAIAVASSTPCRPFLSLSMLKKNPNKQTNKQTNKKKPKEHHKLKEKRTSTNVNKFQTLSNRLISFKKSKMSEEISRKSLNSEYTE